MILILLPLLFAVGFVSFMWGENDGWGVNCMAIAVIISVVGLLLG